MASLNKISQPFARLALFVIYFWFGFLKLIDVSPANPLVMQLQRKTLPFLSFHQFIVPFALFEMLIGVLFLFPELTQLASSLFALHMLTAFLPLICLPALAWQKFLAPTLEGQYILKNLALIALVIILAADPVSVRNKD